MCHKAALHCNGGQECRCQPPIIGPIENVSRPISESCALDFPDVCCAYIFDREALENYNPDIAKLPRDCLYSVNILIGLSAMPPDSGKLPTNHQPSPQIVKYSLFE